MERRVASLIDALRASGDPVETDLAGRLWRCQQQRHERRLGLRDRVDRPCRSVACEHCRRWRGREWRERAAAQMRKADNSHSSLVTVVLERTGDFPAVRDVVRDFRIALRNLRDRKARDDVRWRQMAVVGLAELDMLAVDDVVLLPPSRRAVIAALPVRSHADHLAVVVHVHLAVSHPGLPRRTIEAAFMQQWPGRNRVDVRGFRDDATAAANVGGIIAYASKFTMDTTFHGDVTLPVPVEWQARYWGWLHGLGSGLAPLRVRVSAMRDPVVPETRDPVVPEVADMEPLPVLMETRRWN